MTDPSIIKGSLSQFLASQGLPRLARANPGQELDTAKDITRTPFWGIIVQAALFLKIWLDPARTQVPYYMQGNMSARSAPSLVLFKGGCPLPFLRPDEKEEDLEHIETTEIDFGYLDEENRPCGLSIYFRTDDPSKWVITHAKNTNQSPDEHQVTMLTSVDTKYFQKDQLAISETTIPSAEFAEAIGSPVFVELIKAILGPDGKIHPNAKIIGMLTQFLSFDQDIDDNSELLAGIEGRFPELLENKVLSFLLQNELRLKPANVLECLDLNSPLYQSISTHQYSGDSILRFKQLRVLLFLNEHQLTEPEGLLQDQALVLGLDSAKVINEAKLADYLRDEKLEQLRFLLKTDDADNLFKKLISAEEKSGEVVWSKLSFLAAQQWEFPKDRFRHSFICQVLLNQPSISEETLSRLLEELPQQSELEEIFEPRYLADFLSEDNEESVVANLIHDRDFFKENFPKYKRAALYQKPFSSTFLKRFAAFYVDAKPEDKKLLAEWSFCSEDIHIEAAYLLHQKGIETALIKAYITKANVASYIVNLRNFKLEEYITSFLAGPDSYVLDLILNLPFSERLATVLLAAQGLLGPKELTDLMEAFKTYPQLGSAIVDAQKQGFTAEQLKTLAFSPLKHRALAVLTNYDRDIKFSYDDLSDFACQTLLSVNEFFDEEARKNWVIRAYLKAATKNFLAILRKEEDKLEEAKGDKSQQEPDEVQLIEKIDRLLFEQALVFRIADQYKIELPVKGRVIAKELARAVFLLDSFERSPSSEIYRHVYQGFADLPAETNQKEETTKLAIEALRSNISLGTKPIVPFATLLQNQKFAEAIIGAAERELLIDPKSPIIENLIPALSKLYRISPQISKRSYELAMMDNEQGHDFRMLLALIPENADQSLVDLLEYKIDDRGINRIEKSKIKGLNQLDESALVVNRLRALDMDEELIEFLFKKGEKNDYFYRAILKIETQSEGVRKRLEVEHSKKYNALIEPEKEYRKSLYQAMYESLKPQAPDSEPLPIEQKSQILKDRVTAAANKIMEPLQADSAPVARSILVFFANMATIASMIIGVGFYLHYHHYKKTGDLFFYTSTKSEESYKTLTSETLEETLEEIVKPSPPQLK